MNAAMSDHNLSCASSEASALADHQNDPDEDVIDGKFYSFN